jgi:hypothetical protein
MFGARSEHRKNNQETGALNGQSRNVARYRYSVNQNPEITKSQTTDLREYTLRPGRHEAVLFPSYCRAEAIRTASTLFSAPARLAFDLLLKIQLQAIIAHG